jgi:acetyltransferase
MCGLGGIFAEALADAAFAVAPLTMEEAVGVIDRIKAKKLLGGFRGLPPLDKNAFAKVLVSLGDLGCNWENIDEIDINPLIVENGTPIAVDASIILKK